MNVLFLTLARINDIEDRGIYNDLLREFIKEGHHVFIVNPIERKFKKQTFVRSGSNYQILNVKTFNLQKTNTIEKGIGTLAIEHQYLKAIKKHFSRVKFDLVLYSTPPITLSKVISYIKRRDKAYTYLLLKDIFPQNAIDMKLISKGGLLHKMFLKKERKLYEISDTIGCMSQANVEYVLKNNHFVSKVKIEVNPNSIFPVAYEEKSNDLKNQIKKQYNIPLSKKVFIYGGNLGIPQGLDFLLETIASVKNDNVFFLIVGSGTEYKKMYDWFTVNQPKNALLLSFLKKEDYDDLVSICDVGLIFLHRNFTIPNFPSRMLSYLEMKLPIIAATDVNTDIGKVIEDNKCGFWVESGNIEAIKKAISKMVDNDEEFMNMQKNTWQLLEKEYHVAKSFKLIKEKLNHV